MRFLLSKKIILSSGRLEIYGMIALLGTLWLFLMGVLGMGELRSVSSAAAPHPLEVYKGESLIAFTGRLEREGKLVNPRFLHLLAYLRGDTRRIKAGEYTIAPGDSLGDMLDYLVDGKARFISLTIPEGYALRDIAARIDALRLAEGAEVLRLATDAEFIASLKLSPQLKIPQDHFISLEGILFPETYFISRGMSARALLTQMVRQFKTQAQKLLVKEASTLGLTPYQVLVLASIIEKETGQAHERRRISAVFHNRLKASIKLGSDPTVIYGIENFDGNLTRKHLRTRTPYNTYTIYGLPPTPIASPGLASVKAALSPEAVDDLYFVSKGDGTHFFSKDLETHEQAVWKYQKRRQRKKST